MADLVVTTPPDLEQERRFACDVVLRDWLGLDAVVETGQRADIRIAAVDDPAGRALHLPDVFFARAAAAWLAPASLPAMPLSSWEPGPLAGPVEGPVPVLYGVPADGPAIAADGCRITLPIDVFGAVFFLISRYEELVATLRDRHDRFPAAAVVGQGEGLLERPLANDYLEILWAAMQRLWPALRRRPRRYEVAPSHDIDLPFAALGRPWPRVVLGITADLARRRSPVLAARRLAARLAPQARAVRLDPNNSFAFILATSERLGLKSTFFAKGGASDPRYDDDYGLDAPPVAALLRDIHARGHELGLHPSYHTYRDPDRLRAEFETLLGAADRLGLRQASWGGRQHYLRFATPATWRHYAAAGLAYDATLGLADAPGFRCGTCYDFPVYDLEQRAALPLRERPLIVMEATLLDRGYLGLAPDAARARIVKLAAICRRYAGTFSLLWHNNRLVTAAEQRLYGSIMAEIAP
jgi:hypothetical protein